MLTQIEIFNEIKKVVEKVQPNWRKNDILILELEKFFETLIKKQNKGNK